MIMQSGVNLAQEADFCVQALHVFPKACRVEANQAAISVEPKVMELLVLLARANGQNVTREEIVGACWEGRAVSDDAITRTLGKARKIATLTDPPAFRIETRPKVGVRLVSSDSILQEQSGQTTQAKPAAEPLLIVLPFENLSTDADLSFFSDGVSEEVLSRIIRGSKLKVIGAASSARIRGPDRVEAARALGATHIVDGSVRRGGNRVRINAHLSEVEMGAGLWADQFEGDLGDIFALQDEIADGIAQALFAKFTPATRALIDPAVYDLYLRAKNLVSQPETLLQSIASLERVTQQAPGFADGWGRLASLRAFMRLNLPYKERAIITTQLRHDIERCRILDPDNREVTYSDYWLSPAYGDFHAHERIIQRGLTCSNPNADDFAIASFHFYNVGLFRLSYDLGLKAVSQDPSNWGSMINHAISLWPVQSGEACRDALRRHVDHWPEDQQGTGYLIFIACAIGDWDEIDRLTDPKRLAQFPLRENSGLIATAATMRYPTLANRQFLFDMMKARVEKHGAFDAAFVAFSSLIGMAEHIYPVIENLRFGPSHTKGDALGLMGYRTHLLFTPAAKNARADPRFVTLCARLGLVDYWLTQSVWPDCVDEVPYDFKAACLAARDTARDPLIE
jgi:TolB-like protein